jgi:hypothetical protein
MIFFFQLKKENITLEVTKQFFDNNKKEDPPKTVSY